MEARSGVKFEEAQVALARQWMGEQANAGGVDPIKEVFIKSARPTTEGVVETKSTALKLTKVPLPVSDEEAREKVARFESGADQLRGDDAVADSVAQHKFEDRTTLQSEQWLGTEDEERNA